MAIQKTYTMIKPDGVRNGHIGEIVNRFERAGLTIEQMRLEMVTPEQAKGLAEGHAVRLDGCRNKEGQTFSCYVQFDAAQRQVVACHPAWLKEAQKTGTDLGLGQQNKQEKKPLKEVKQEKKKAAQVKR